MENKYHFNLPPDLIATIPASPRDSARLFVYNTQTDEVIFDVFANLDDHLPEQSLMVLNDTKVVPARLLLKKASGGKVEILLLVNEPAEAGLVKGLSDRKIKAGDQLYFDETEYLEVVRQDEKIFFFRPSFSLDRLPEFLDKFGTTPIPKYIKGLTLREAALRERYQTVFAKNPFSIAAPTASLHFTDRVFDKLADKQIDRAFVTLQVGLGTFAPVTDENMARGKLHREWCRVDEGNAKKIHEAKAAGRKIIAVGTTATRTLESMPELVHSGAAMEKSTDLFIRPPYEFRLADILITNFHLPESSLMMLVDAFLQAKAANKSVTELYQLAVAEKFRFYSFGDAMLIL
jgi:S-adenosylmethionine:tRNA ribosyltransferase-isomerase